MTNLGMSLSVYKKGRKKIIEGVRFAAACGR